jgi:hypothetical protein
MTKKDGHKTRPYSFNVASSLCNITPDT